MDFGMGVRECRRYKSGPRQERPMSDQEKPQKPRGPVAIDSMPWTEWGDSVRYQCRYRTLSDTRKGGRKIGIGYEELLPGKQSVPFHYHMLEEEHIIALEGEATLRLGEERYTIKAGDYVGFPAGERVGHCIINESDAPFRFIIIGDRQPNEVCIYPDSKKVMVRAYDSVILRYTENLDYYDGEHADEPGKGKG
jgi:uncharacterized cupin superfamily protein